MGSIFTLFAMFIFIGIIMQIINSTKSSGRRPGAGQTNQFQNHANDSFGNDMNMNSMNMMNDINHNGIPDHMEWHMDRDHDGIPDAIDYNISPGFDNSYNNFDNNVFDSNDFNSNSFDSNSFDNNSFDNSSFDSGSSFSDNN